MECLFNISSYSYNVEHRRWEIYSHQVRANTH